MIPFNPKKKLSLQNKSLTSNRSENVAYRNHSMLVFDSLKLLHMLTQGHDGNATVI